MKQGMSTDMTSHFGFNLFYTFRAIFLAFLCIAVCAAIMRLGFIPALQAVLNLSESNLSLVRRSGMIVAFTFGYWVYVHLIEKRSAEELIIKPLTILVSGFMGALAIGAPIALLFALGVYTLIEHGPGSGLAGIGLTIFAAALLEEIIFRGVLFRIVEKWFGIWIALALPSVLFSFLHIFNDNWVGWLPLLSVVLLGMMWTLIFIFTRNIWACALNHAAWNYTIFLTGLPLTGQQEWRSLAPLKSEFHGETWVSGGIAGPEATLTSIIWVAVIVVLMAFQLLKKQQSDQ